MVCLRMGCRLCSDRCAAPFGRLAAKKSGFAGSPAGSSGSDFDRSGRFFYGFDETEHRRAVLLFGSAAFLFCAAGTPSAVACHSGSRSRCHRCIMSEMFAGNLRSSLRLGGGRRERFFAWGLFLFFLCDLNVGAMNLGDYLRLPDFYWQQIRPFCSGILWIFYLPSQILISFSECNRIIERKKESD